MIRKAIIAGMIWFASATSFANELSQYTVIRVQKAHELAQKEQVKQAIAKLKEIETSREYDKAFVARMLGVFYWQDGKTKSAIKQLEYAVNSNQLNDEQAWISQRMLADLLVNDQQFKKALPHYYKLVKSVPTGQKGVDLWLRIAQSHYQIEQFKQVIPAVDKYRRAKGKDELQPLSLKLSAQLQLQRWKSAIPTLERLIALQPDKLNWWRQLVSLQMRVGQNNAALDTLALAKLQGLPLSQQDRRLLAQLYAQRGIPERAAIEVSQLDAAKSDIDLVVAQATYWQQAREWDKAIVQWKLAANKNSKYHWNVAQLLVQEGQYNSALTVLNKVKGKKSQVALAKTRAYYKLDQLEKALIEAKKAEAIAPSKQAKSWIKYLSQLRKAKATQTS
ncbi:bacterial transcriptional activator domain-containing protein [Vibrio intestinalis]|uniref:bacterial transcriptional activator domain-containing protein n=1 Tax=Vibrio intestinalis TaxID=2933291 RepID=UPI0021A7F7FB|nr:bacterial transcriptional activator domain-containing protein [Vibrio intestinalis]